MLALSVGVDTRAEQRDVFPTKQQHSDAASVAPESRPASHLAVPGDELVALANLGLIIVTAGLVYATFNLVAATKIHAAHMASLVEEVQRIQSVTNRASVEQSIVAMPGQAPQLVFTNVGNVPVRLSAFSFLGTYGHCTTEIEESAPAVWLDRNESFLPSVELLKSCWFKDLRSAKVRCTFSDGAGGSQLRSSVWLFDHTNNGVSRGLQDDC